MMAAKLLGFTQICVSPQYICSRDWSGLPGSACEDSRGRRPDCRLPKPGPPGKRSFISCQWGSRWALPGGTGFARLGAADHSLVTNPENRGGEGSHTPTRACVLGQSLTGECLQGLLTGDFPSVSFLPGPYRVVF